MGFDKKAPVEMTGGKSFSVLTHLKFQIDFLEQMVFNAWVNTKELLACLSE